MTREEAIAILKNRDMHGVPCGYTSGYSEALDMAIEALKADVARWSSWNKTFEQSGIADLISRADATEAVASADETNGTVKVFSGLEIIDILNALPSAEQVTSKLKNPCDSLLTDDLGECKEQKSKLDIISREDAMEKLDDFCKWCKDGRLQGAEFVLDCFLPNLPSADRPQGEWINTNYRNYRNELIFECSQCKAREIKRGNYCPNCGADMRGEDDE